MVSPILENEKDNLWKVKALNKWNFPVRGIGEPQDLITGLWSFLWGK